MSILSRSTAGSAILAVLSVAPLMMPSAALAGECGSDPIYSRAAVGKTITGARVRSIACMEGSDILTVVPGGTQLDVIGETDGWYKVKFGGHMGWMGSQLVTLTQNGSSPKMVKEMMTEPIKEKPKPSASEKEILKSIIGVNERDFEKLEDGHENLFRRMKGRMIMRVHARGQVYAVEKDGSLRLLPNWKSIKARYENKPTADDKSITGQGMIALEGVALSDGRVKLAWNIKGLEASKGFKVVWSQLANPTYPGNEYHYLSDASARRDVIETLSNGTYHFRVCEYLGGSCGVYSNDIKLTVNKQEEKKEVLGYKPIATELVLSGQSTADGVRLNWSACTASGFQGYKVVRSSSDGDLYYPKSGYRRYLTNRSETSYLDTDISSGQSYYYRICSLESDSPVTCGNVIRVFVP
jgi:hypothetical protein